MSLTQPLLKKSPKKPNSTQQPSPNNSLHKTHKNIHRKPSSDQTPPPNYSLEKTNKNIHRKPLSDQPPSYKKVIRNYYYV